MFHFILPPTLLLAALSLSHLVGVSASAAGALPDASVSRTESVTPGASSAAALRPFVDRGALAGAVTLVAGPQRVLSLEAVGYADIAARRKMRPDDVFWIASQTKSFTATAVMILVDEGKVRLDDPVEKYLPEFGNLWLAAEKDDSHLLLRRPERLITVRHLLSHTSGLPHFSALEDPTFAATGTFGTTRLLPLRDAVRGYAMTPLQFEPGSRWQYCNGGINTAGRIIEVVSGMPFERFLEERLFKPLGMKDTTFSPDRRQLARLAKAYRSEKVAGGADGGARRLVETAIPLFDHPLDGRRNLPMPAGGLFSTAADLARFCQMLLNGGVAAGGKRILSEGMIREMTTRQADTTDGQAYGLGWFTNPDGSFGHNGAFSTVMTVDPKRRLVKLFLVQHEGGGDDLYQAYQAFDRAASESVPNPSAESGG